MRTLTVLLFVALAVVLISTTSAEECTPGDYKEEDCNSCVCTETGVWGCTKRQCFDKRAINQRHQAPECKVGESKTDDCNRCRCVGYGKWACTRMRCLHKRDFPVPSDVQNVPCPPYDTFMLECNKCTCNFQGSGYQCTQQICSSTLL
ncbi:hypothetical protein Trydic_g13911 [Trypoxylus dichotomus]